MDLLSLILLFVVVLFVVIIVFNVKKLITNAQYMKNINAQYASSRIGGTSSRIGGVSGTETFLMEIQKVFPITGRGAIVVGKIKKGSVRVGDEIEIIGGPKTLKTKVGMIEKAMAKVYEAKYGDDVGILLEGIPELKVKEGYSIVKY